MSTGFLLEAPIGLLPVAVFLAMLLRFDSYKLVSLRETLFALTAGMALCGVAFWANVLLLETTHMGFSSYSRFVAPAVEETIKGAAIVWLIARNRIGFLIDAAIMGFAVGTGFALVENLYYLYGFPDANVGTWIVRGFGTAIMHGGAVTLLAVLSQLLVDRVRSFNPLLFLPGLAAAIALHQLYNVFAAPLLATVAILVVLPVALYFLFAKSEHKVHSWLLHDYEDNERLLADIRSGAFTNSEAGRFITQMAARLGPQVAADMFAFIRIHTELAIRADLVDLAREKNERLPILDSDREKFAKLHELERRIGRTAMMALWPHMHFTRKELWELNEFEQEVREG